MDYDGVDSPLALALAVIVENQQETGGEGKRHLPDLGQGAVGRHPNGWIFPLQLSLAVKVADGRWERKTVVGGRSMGVVYTH